MWCDDLHIGVLLHRRIIDRSLPKGLCVFKIYINYMEEIRKVRKVGNSIVLSFHQKFGLVVGDYVKIRREKDQLIITRVEI